MVLTDYAHAPWFQELPHALQTLIRQSTELLQREKRLHSHLADYSFVLFSLSKAYEGYLKKFLHDQGLISQQVYEGRKFRIGRALNPDLPDQQRDQWWLYDDVVRVCGEQRAREMWHVWINCRNHVFHFMPTQRNVLQLDDVENRVESVLRVMEALSYCTIPDHTTAK